MSRAITPEQARLLIRGGEGLTKVSVRESVTRGTQGQRTPEVIPEVAPEVTPEVRLLKVVSGEKTRRELQTALSLKDGEHFRKNYLLPALAAGLIEMTIPDKPRSSKQQYRLTDKGREIATKTGTKA